MTLLSGLVLGQTPHYQSPVAGPVPQKINLPVTPAATPGGEVVEDVVVRVNDQIISRSEVERSEQQLRQELQQTGASATDAADREKNLLRDMIDQQLLLSRAKELGLNADAEVIRRLDEIRKQNKLDSLEDLEKAARQQGVSYEDFKANIRNGILTQQVVRDEVGRRLQVTQAQLQAYYAAHRAEFTQPEQVRLSEILIPTAAEANDAAIAQAQAKADEVAAKVKGGAKFEELAKTYSGGPTAAQGGDLGLFKRGTLAKVLEDQTFALKPGEATAPIRTRQGFVILKVTEHAASGVPPLKEVEPQVQEALYLDQMQPALRAYLTKLREDAYIDIKPGFVDSGASVKQTKPVFTAYTAPVAKTKKAVRKQRFDRGTAFSSANRTPAAAPRPDAKAAAPSADTPALAGVATGATPPRLKPVVQADGPMAKIKHGKVKREKIRFGQAPRNSLPAGSEQEGLAADNGLGANHELHTAATDAAAATARGGDTPAQVASSSVVPEVNPFAPAGPPAGKTRFSDRAKTEAATKAAKKDAKVKEKALAAAPPVTAEEKAAAQTQAAPLGLAGDTAPKKKVRVKGAPKERLQQQAVQPKPPTPEATPAKAADRATPYEGTAGAPKKPVPGADDSTLPAVTAPASSTPQSTATPATPGNPIPTTPPE
jgi:peptidyl-prolyl cis-trans isomerase SurA